jgi:glutamyl-tRNA synthetase
MTANSAVVGRLAPSPTGALHLGNIRSFLLAWLDIRSRNGTLLLRIEDLDGPRIKRGSAEQLLADLAWLGLDYDEQIVFQSERGHHYQAALDLLIEQQNVYPCTCSRREIELAASAPHAEDGSTVYPLTCYQRYDSIAAAEQNSERPPCMRFHFDQPSIQFKDAVCGDQKFDTKQLSDFVVSKSNGDASYQLAVVVDDAAQGVTEVLRGDDLLDSAARQIAIYQALGLSTPEFKHVPLVVGADGLRLAKRHGDTRLDYFRQTGVRPQLILGWLAYASGLCSTLQEMSASELLDSYDLNNLAKKPLVWRGEFSE